MTGLVVGSVLAVVGLVTVQVARRRRWEIRRAIEIMLDPPPEDPDDLLAFQVAHGIYRCPPGCTEHEHG